MSYLSKAFYITIISSFFVGMTVVCKNVSDGRLPVCEATDSVTIATDYSEKCPDDLNISVENHSNTTIYIGRTYGLLTQNEDEWAYIAKGRMLKCITIPPTSKRKFRVSLCVRDIRSSSGWAYTATSLYKVRLDQYDHKGDFVRKLESSFRVSGNLLWHLNDGLVIIHLD